MRGRRREGGGTALPGFCVPRSGSAHAAAQLARSGRYKSRKAKNKWGFVPPASSPCISLCRGLEAAEAARGSCFHGPAASPRYVGSLRSRLTRRPWSRRPRTDPRGLHPLVWSLTLFPLRLLDPACLGPARGAESRRRPLVRPEQRELPGQVTGRGASPALRSLPAGGRIQSSTSVPADRLWLDSLLGAASTRRRCGRRPRPSCGERGGSSRGALI